MLENENTKMIYSKLQKQLFYMIPEKWDRIYLYASVAERIGNIETGELFFYYFPKGLLRKNPVNSYEIPAKFNLDEEAYVKLAENLYGLIKKLRNEFKRAGEELWSSLTIKVENFHFKVEFCYDNTNRDEEEKHLIWRYKNLKNPIESYTKLEKQIILQYLQEEKISPSKVETYTEPMYKSAIKNVVQYNKERDAFIVAKEDSGEQIAKSSKNDKEKSKTEYTALPKDYTYKKKQNKALRESKILKSKFIGQEVKNNQEPELKLEEQIHQQINAVKSQILNHY